MDKNALPQNYIRYIRQKVGHDPIILNFAGCCVLNERGEVLLQKRPDRGGVWGIPGGAMELGESFSEAALRETREETGLDVELLELLGIYSKDFTYYDSGDSAQSVCVVFVARALRQGSTNDDGETMELRYFSSASLPPLFTRQHEKILKDLFSGVRNRVE